MPIIPLFPLNTVLFPGQVLPLHIFEPRYKLMIQDCLAKQIPFGVVLIREGSEVGEAADPFEFGTTARIHQVNPYPDGRMDIMCIGESRFRIEQTFLEEEYLTAQVSYSPWEPTNLPNINQLRGQVYEGLVLYLKILSGLSKTEIQLSELPEETLPLACVAAIAMRLSNREKQEILSTSTDLEFLELLKGFLHRENNALKITSAVPDTGIYPTESISLN